MDPVGIPPDFTRSQPRVRCGSGLQIAAVLTVPHEPPQGFNRRPSLQRLVSLVGGNRTTDHSTPGVVHLGPSRQKPQFLASGDTVTDPASSKRHGHFGFAARIDPVGVEIESHGLPDHLVGEATRHQVPSLGHMAFMASRRLSSPGFVLAKLLQAGLLQGAVEAIGKVGVLEGELVASRTELGSTQAKILSHRVFRQSPRSDPGGDNNSVTNMTGQAVNAAGEPIRLIPEGIVESGRLGRRQPSIGNPRRVTVQAELLPPAAGFQALDDERVAGSRHAVPTLLPLVIFLLVTRAAPGVGPRRGSRGHDRIESMVEQDRRLGSSRLQDITHLPRSQAGSGKQQDGNGVGKTGTHGDRVHHPSHRLLLSSRLGV